MNKGGLSEVVTTVLIILLVIAAIIIIWVFARMFIFGASGQVESGLFTSNLVIKKNSVYYNTTQGDISFVVERKAGFGNLAGVNVILDGERGDSCTIRINGTIKELESRIIGPINYTGCKIGNLTRLSIAPIVFNKDGRELQGEVTDRYKLGESIGNVVSNDEPPVDDCNNGVAGSEEECDMSDLKGETCLTQGYDYETTGLSCTSSCEFNYVGCANYDLTTGLVSYWKFDEASGSTAVDSADGNSGAINGASRVSCTSPSQRALSFDGINDNLQVTDSDSLDVSPNVTFTSWINIAGTAGGSDRYIAIKDRAYGVRLNGDSNRLRISLKNQSNSAIFDYISTVDLNNNTWYHISYTFNGSTLVVYINGSQVTSVVRASQNGDLGITTLDLGIGWNPGSGAGIFNGLIDEVKIYNRTLSNTEIQELYNLGHCEIAVPNVPSNLQALTISSSKINLSWQDNSNNEDGFKIARSTNPSSGFTDIANVGADIRSYLDNSLNYSTTYYYRVRAYSGLLGDSVNVSASNTTYASPILVTNNNGLLAYWKFDEFSGVTSYDHSGRGNTATLAHGANFASGKNGNSLNLDGSDDYALANVSLLPIGNSPRTVTFWVYHISGDDSGVLFDYGNENVGSGIFALGRDGANVVFWGSGNDWSPGSGLPIPANQWVFVAATLNNSVMTLRTDSATMSNPITLNTQPGRVFLGVEISSDAQFESGFETHLLGKLDEVAVWNRSLSASEIQAIYDDQKT